MKQVGLEPETEGSVASERQEQTAGELCERAKQNEHSEDNPDT